MFPNFNPVNKRPDFGRNRHERRAAKAGSLHALYQCFVETKSGEPIAVGPKADKELVDKFCEALNAKIIRERETDWHDAYVVLAKT